MSISPTPRRYLAAGALTLAGVAAMALPASADTYDDAIQLSWDGTSYADSTTESFVGTPVTVPGDTAERTLLVRNDGPTDATLRASIIDIELNEPDAADVHHNPDHVAPAGEYAGAGDQGNYYDDVHLVWDGGEASFTDLDAEGTTVILEIPLAQGEEVPVTIGYDYPVGATSGNHANVAERLASFDVLLELGGELPAEPTPTPDLPETGADLGLAGLAAVLAVGVGAALLRGRALAARSTR
ncbi:hypothetical protein LQF12_01400 [Ruania suaedae]|uniref:hypothetical protein n=1 Tax=Ruania suaedae TaxID=2897774 RepID=UPI001E59048A|nr:hypothetical protein [Ruania suaedae]UFU03297.1 hypothetical protein LQF12_01400 [Ruania suaedae]